MTTHKRHQAFIDALDGKPTATDALSEEERAMLALASDLSASDYSAMYGERAALRRRLLNQVDHAREGWSTTGDSIKMFQLITQNKRRLAIAVLVMVCVGGLALARFSPALADSRYELATWMTASDALPQGFEAVVFTILADDWPGDGIVIRSEDGSVTQFTIYTVDGFEEAQAVANFPLKQPSALPEGFTLSSGSVSEAGDWVHLAYTNDAGEIITFHQTTNPDALAGDAVSGIPVIASGGQMEEEIVLGEVTATVTGTPLSESIRWEADGVSYSLLGTLDNAALHAVADSVN